MIQIYVALGIQVGHSYVSAMHILETGSNLVPFLYVVFLKWEEFWTVLCHADQYVTSNEQLLWQCEHNMLASFCNTSIARKASNFGICILLSSVETYDFLVIYIQCNCIIHEAHILFQISTPINPMFLLP
jgi:hypothetical protein